MNAGITLKDLLSFGSIGATVIGCAFFFGSLTHRVETLEKSTVTAERIARMETNIDNMTRSASDLRASVDLLSRQIRRNRNGETTNEQ